MKLSHELKIKLLIDFNDKSNIRIMKPSNQYFLGARNIPVVNLYNETYMWSNFLKEEEYLLDEILDWIKVKEKIDIGNVCGVFPIVVNTKLDGVKNVKFSIDMMRVANWKDWFIQ